MSACHSEVTPLAHQDPSSVQISTRNFSAKLLNDNGRDMFMISDTTTAAINIRGAIDALESALDRYGLASEQWRALLMIQEVLHAPRTLYERVSG